ncbi:ATP-dependent helicase [Nocardioides panaciterrulae]|uniref:DNA 3'-5' helicase n=1 Tax=Nocardioides panaciterrulae TaxID=661492 RepID=A0A7Y9JAE4_9ACTN|nr:ATP-dependent DNA helicase [Nocardioides panaciterrulae]NYD41031.1 superfamily I DNA/RNA helicase/RecB family exonuclease [Nocardioides panaciterrulae]
MSSPAAATTYQLVRPPTVTDVPTLDEHQQRVVDHPGGPLLVLAGPGTGKTTTMVEAIVRRVEEGARPDQVLALTFSRKAAEQLRDRVTARLGRTMSTTLSSTFHSFAYGLVRLYAPSELYAAPLRLLSAPEQDVVLTELLTDHPESVRWPDALRAAVGTRGFAREVHAVLARARERGLDPDDLVELGRRERVPEFEAAGHFLRQYLDVLGNQSAIDYPDLIARAVVEAEAHRHELRARFRHVFVDEYQDTDPSQVALLRALAGDGRDLTVVGDPDQSIYGFRGADVRGILDFPHEFRAATGEPAPVVALGTTRRFGSRLLRASRTVAAGIAVRGAIPAEQYAAFRSPEPAPNSYGAGSVEVLTFDTARAETENVADLLRRAHLEDGVPWSEMAVLVRSGRSSIPGLRRSLAAAGVPVEVASDETPLVREPAVVPLLATLALVVDAGVEDPAADDFVGADRVEAALTSPLGGLDATDVRALTRALRRREPETPARELLRGALLEPGALAGIEGEPARRALRLADLIARARQELDDGATIEQVLWVLWDGSDWGRRLRIGTQAGGTGARLAHRDLDAICALFETAARAEEQQGHASIASFLGTLRAQEIPADTLADRGVRGEAVRLLTAHRSKGLEWRLVVVAHVQEGAWPDLRRRDSLLGADRIGRDGLLPPLTRGAVLAEERRLFYVAVTRARQRLVVTAVRSPDDEGEQPSRFVDELGHAPVHRIGRPRRPLSMPGLVAELRRTLADPDQPEPLRAAAASRLRMLAETDVHGRPVAPGADPATWWGLRAPSRSDRPVRPSEEPLTISASALEGLLTCPAQWFLQREAGGAVVSSASQGFGKIVHAVAERIASGDVGADPGSAGAGDEAGVLALVDSMIDEVWERMEFRTPWSRSRERVAVADAIRRFLAWSRRPGARTLLATEPKVRAEVRLPDGRVVRLHGYADRLELDEAGRVVVVDLKTGKYPPTGPEVERHAQLGLYQLAVEHGAADEVLGRPAEPGGAELVQLRVGGELPKVQLQSPQPAAEGRPRPIEEQLMQAVSALRAEEFVARPGGHCDRCAFQALCPSKAAGTVLS